MTEAATQTPFWNKTNIIFVTTLAIFLLWLGFWFYGRAGYVHVTDARVSATMISVSSRIPGWLVDFPVSDGMTVKQGDVLVHIDPRDAQLQLDRLEAGLENMEVELGRFETEYQLRQQQLASNISASTSRLKVARSALSESDLMLAKASRNFGRSKSLLADRMVSVEEHDDREVAFQELEQTHEQRVAEGEVAEAELRLAQASLAEMDVMRANHELTRGRKKALEIEHDRLANTIKDHTIVSSINGVVDETFANTGEYVYPGQRILMIHDPTRLWIKANVKETDIRHLKIGQPVSVSVDAYPDQQFSGHIANIGNAATSQFALLPSPNPSGNFTKVTQRLEVQISLDEAYDVLRPGMMVELAIEIDADCCTSPAVADAG
ncbi:MAG: membrane fusion protein (multidrug efflux system) [Candidatus Azotimanducaceae bacterium]|jgi:membrane fusion protein (multidrug efflux system)